jgi:hypothetical protein
VVYDENRIMVKLREMILMAGIVSRAGLAIFHPGTFHGTFRPVSTGIR